VLSKQSQIRIFEREFNLIIKLFLNFLKNHDVFKEVFL